MEDIRLACYQRLLQNNIVGLKLEETETTRLHDKEIQKNREENKGTIQKGSSVLSHSGEVVKSTPILGVQRDLKIIGLANVFRLLYQKKRDNSATVPLWWNWNHTSLEMRIALSRMHTWAGPRPFDVIRLLRYAMVSYYVLADEGNRKSEKKEATIEVRTADTVPMDYFLSDVLYAFVEEYEEQKKEGQERSDFVYYPHPIENKLTRKEPEPAIIENYDRIRVECERKEDGDAMNDLYDIFIQLNEEKKRAQPMTMLGYLTKRKVFRKTFLEYPNLKADWDTFRKDDEDLTENEKIAKARKKLQEAQRQLRRESTRLAEDTRLNNPVDPVIRILQNSKEDTEAKLRVLQSQLEEALNKNKDAKERDNQKKRELTETNKILEANRNCRGGTAKGRGG